MSKPLDTIGPSQRLRAVQALREHSGWKLFMEDTQRELLRAVERSLDLSLDDRASRDARVEVARLKQILTWRQDAEKGFRAAAERRATG